jgi:hypothetical protein
LAQNAYAYDVMGINVQKLGLGEEEREELQKWLDKKPKPAVQEFKRNQTKIPKIRKKIAEEFSLPSSLVNDANKMADIYPDLYLLENLVRHVIMTILSKKYGNDWWNNRSIISKKIADKVEDRKHFEGENRWVAKRGVHEIFYTDFADLSRIIAANPAEFRKVFADMEIEAELRKLEPLRNIIAHNNPLRPKDIKRVQLCLNDLQEQLKNYAEKERKT